MKDLEYWARKPLWDDEPCWNMCGLPISMSREDAQEAGWKLARGVPDDQVYEVGDYVCAASPQSHIGPYRHAIDFLVPDGTPVLATQGGIVIEIKENSNQWGPTSESRDLLNYVTISHPDSTYSQYCHLGYKSVSKHGLRVGSVVRKGQVIAEVGKTGWTDRDHLHFIVFRSHTNESPYTFKSLWIYFEGIDDPPVDLSL